VTGSLGPVNQPSSSADPTPRPAALPVWPAVLCDLVCVVVFTVVGTVNHATAGALGHVASVAVPFLVGLAVGWLATRAWRAPAQVWPTGVAVWFATVVLGLALRPVLGIGGVEPSFAIVTAVFLGVTMLGWRALASFAARRRTP
jgi:FtsH-binding integral membrane protein